MPTPNLGLHIPTPGTEDGTWGELVNENMEALDFLFTGWLSRTGTTVTATIPQPFLASLGADALGATEDFASVLGVAAASATEADVQLMVNEPGTLRRFRVKLSAAPGAGEERVFTLRVNGVDSAAVIAIDETNDDVADLVTEVAVVSGDLLSWKCEDTNGTAAAASAFFAAEMVR